MNYAHCEPFDKVAPADRWKAVSILRIGHGPAGEMMSKACKRVLRLQTHIRRHKDHRTGK